MCCTEKRSERGVGDVLWVRDIITCVVFLNILRGAGTLYMCKYILLARHISFDSFLYGLSSPGIDDIMIAL